MEEKWTWRAKTRYNRTECNVNQWKRGNRVGVKGFEQDKPARNESGWLVTVRGVHSMEFRKKSGCHSFSNLPSTRRLSHLVLYHPLPSPFNPIQSHSISSYSTLSRPSPPRYNTSHPVSLRSLWSRTVPFRPACPVPSRHLPLSLLLFQPVPSCPAPYYSFPFYPPQFQPALSWTGQWNWTSRRYETGQLGTAMGSTGKSRKGWNGTGLDEGGQDSRGLHCTGWDESGWGRMRRDRTRGDRTGRLGDTE